MPLDRTDNSRKIRAPRGSELTCKSWLTEAPYRMLQNNLDPEVAEKNPSNLSSTVASVARRVTGSATTRYSNA